MNYYKIIFWTIFLFCIPITVPFIVLGSLGRIIESAYFYGPDEDDFELLENKDDCTQSEVGETAREFLAEFTKMTDIKKENK